MRDYPLIRMEYDAGVESAVFSLERHYGEEAYDEYRKARKEICAWCVEQFGAPEPFWDQTADSWGFEESGIFVFTNLVNATVFRLRWM